MTSRAGEELPCTDPGQPDRLVAHAASARPDEVQAAIATAREGLRVWRAVPAPPRAQALIGAAAWLRERRLELAALEVRECAKPWLEADADVCEAIDFLEYYARAALSSAAAASCCRCPASATSCATARAGSSPSSPPGTSRSPSRVG